MARSFYVFLRCWKGGPFQHSREHRSKHRVIKFVDHRNCGFVDGVFDHLDLGHAITVISKG